MKLKYNVDLIYIKSHTGFSDEHSIGNSIADRLAADALKFDNKPMDIRKFFQMSHNLNKEQLLLLQHNLTYEVYEKFMSLFHSKKSTYQQIQMKEINIYLEYNEKS